MSGASTASLSWNADNRLTSVTTSGTSTYTYNGAGLRTSKTVGGTTKTHLTDGDTPASALLSDGLATYVPGVSERRNSTTSFFLFDLLGSVRATSGAAGAASEFAWFEAFGNAVTTADFGGATTSGRPFGFVGGEQYQADAESGLMLLGNRYYDPGIGRFLSSDPAEDGDNFYAYCENNPVNAIDPEGLQHFPPGYNRRMWEIRLGKDRTKFFKPMRGNSPSEEWSWHDPDEWHKEGHWDVTLQYADYSADYRYYPKRKKEKWESKNPVAKKKNKEAQEENKQKNKDKKKGPWKGKQPIILTPAPMVPVTTPAPSTPPVITRPPVFIRLPEFPIFAGGL